jgi:hypothetical protein
MSTENQWETEVGLSTGLGTSAMQRYLRTTLASGPCPRRQKARISRER